MFVPVLLIAATVLQATFGISQSFEIIEPVDLNFKCVKPEIEQPHKSPVLLIHGLIDSLSTWNGVSKALAKRTNRMVCAVDLRNHGDSPWSDRADVPAMAADINHLLNKYGVKKVNIIGNSLGGKVAVDFTLKHPFRVNTAVIEDMRPNGVADGVLEIITFGIIVLKEAIDNVPEGSTEDEANELILNYLQGKLEEKGLDTNLFTEELVNSYGVNCSEKCHFKFNIDALAEAFKDPETFLGESRGRYYGPTLFIYGKNSPFDVGGDEVNIKRLFPNAKLVGVEGASHVFHGIFKQFEDEVVEILNSRLY